MLAGTATLLLTCVVILTCLGLLIGLGRTILRSFVEDIWRSNEVSEPRQRLWDIRFKIVAAIGVISAAAWVVYSYQASAERELRKTLWDKQVSLYFEATEATGTIATTPANVPAYKSAVDRFWTLYYGPLRIVEDDEDVGQAMMSFGLCLPEPGLSEPAQSCSEDVLQQKSLTLAMQCRRSISSSWDRKLDGLRRHH